MQLSNLLISTNMTSQLMSNSSQKRVVFAGSILLLAIFVAPFFTFAKSDKIYVDDDASGTQNGSLAHPYKTISEGIKHAGKKDEVHVASGNYKENITIKEDVRLFGSDEDKVIITAKDNDVPVVFMKDGSRINKVTIRKGRNGIEVLKNSEVSIIDCIIKDNDRDGIRIRAHKKVTNEEAVSIDKTVIKDNGKIGIYSETHRVVVTNSNITSNGSDGIIFSQGTSAWLSGNKVQDNRGSGMKLYLDGSNIWTKSNTFSHNKREGIEVNAYGNGKIDIKKSKIHSNDRYGVARIVRGNAGTGVFNGLTVQADVEFWENNNGNVSPIIRVK